MQFCGKVIQSRSKYSDRVPSTCFSPVDHIGKCEQYPYLAQLLQEAPHLAAKIKRDATMTTGAAWASSDAGPNRILRWVMQMNDDALKDYDIDMTSLSPIIQAKLREKGASYSDCMDVARKLTWLAYGTVGAPTARESIRTGLEAEFGTIRKNGSVCLVCREPIPFSAFAEGRRGRATVETAHALPRQHDAQNVGFAHRSCNIAQGDKDLPAFYGWITQILLNVEAQRGTAT